jgi:predicted DNA-binding WGR domain protein
MASNNDKRNKFYVHLMRDDRHLFYEAWIENDHDSLRVKYKYGTVGTVGKEHWKFFRDDSEWDVQDPALRRKGAEKAVEFVTSKFNELLEKGYREEGADTARYRPIQAVGEKIYLERKDDYTGERSFFQYSLCSYESCPFYVEELQGTIGDRGTSGGFPCFSLEEAVEQIAKIVLHKNGSGYKKKPTPKSINCKIIHPFLSDQSDLCDSSDSSDGDSYASSDSEVDDDNHKKRKRKSAPKRTNKRVATDATTDETEATTATTTTATAVSDEQE